LHKLLVLYMWMQQRSPVVWSDHAAVSDLKERTEKALDWSLQGISRSSRLRLLPDIATLRRRKDHDQIAYVDKRHVREMRLGGGVNERDQVRY